MKVYIVIEHVQYEGTFIYAVCSSNDIAKDYIAKHKPDNRNYEIEEWELNG